METSSEELLVCLSCGGCLTVSLLTLCVLLRHIWNKPRSITLWNQALVAAAVIIVMALIIFAVANREKVKKQSFISQPKALRKYFKKN